MVKKQYQLVKLGYPGGQRKFEWNNHVVVLTGKNAGKRGRITGITVVRDDGFMYFGGTRITDGSRKGRNRAIYWVATRDRLLGEYYSYQLMKCGKVTLSKRKTAKPKRTVLESDYPTHDEGVGDGYRKAIGGPWPHSPPTSNSNSYLT